MKKINLSKDQIQKLVAGVMILGLSVFAYNKYFLQPTLKKIDKTKKEIVELSKRLETLKRRSKSKNRLRIEIAAAERQWEDLKSRLPEDRQLPVLLETVSRIAGKHQIEISQLAPQGVRTVSLYYEIPIRLIGASSYHQLASFLTEMGNLERLFHARGVQMSPRGPTPTNPNASVNADLTLITFQYRGG